ncbi:DMT family transporter [Thermoanaerobacterium sp. DL9XJH110]|uniref:DMT family transporter n=1 Tax=Thermoanaerobacterium sp. DL9XJH110 TaxID=3386643 RepID=UPI003BB6F197
MDSTVKTYLGLLAVAFFWGTSFAVSKEALRELSPMGLAVLRFSLASIIFFALLKTHYRGNVIEKRDRPMLWFLGILGVSSYFYVQYTGLKLTTTVNTAIIIAISPIFTALISSLVFHQERLTPDKILGALIAFAGIFTIFTGRGDMSLGRDTLAGDLLILSNAVAWALFTVLGKSLVDKYDPFVVTAHINIYGTLTMLPLAFAPSFINSFKSMHISTWASALYLAVTCSAFGYFMWYRGVKTLGASRTAVFNYINPLFAVTIGILFLNEPANLRTLLGGAAVLFGVYVASGGRALLNFSSKYRVRAGKN